MDFIEQLVVVERGLRARMRCIMFDAAMWFMQDGQVSSISDVVEQAKVSRVMVYRYFSTQSVLIQVAVDEALGPILKWDSSAQDVEQRVSELIRFFYLCMDEYEALLRAALRLVLDQWGLLHLGKLDVKNAMVRGYRISLFVSVVAPLRYKLGKVRIECLTQVLSFVFGIEVFVVLKDIWGFDRDSAEEVALWTCYVLIRCVAEDLALSVRWRRVNGVGTTGPRFG